MEVKAGGNAATVEAEKPAGGDRRNASELDAWLEKAERWAN